MKTLSITMAALLASSSAFAGEKVSFIKGKPSIFNGKTSFLMELDLSKTAIDALDTEAAFIEYKKNKKDKDSNNWEESWNKDKKGFLTTYTETLARQMKSTQLKFSEDDPSSKYRMVLMPVRIETGNPMKYSSVEMKIHIYDRESSEEVAVIHVRPSRGQQMGPMSPTVGMRVNYAMMTSAMMLGGHIKKSLKAKK